MQQPYKNFKSALSLQERILAKLKQQLWQQEQLLQRLKEALPENLREFAIYAVLRGQQITLFTHSAAYASQMRFYSKQLQASISQQPELSHITHITVRLSMPLNSVRVQPRKAQLPSAASIKCLRTARTHVTNDPLQQALENLGNTLEKLQQRQTVPTD